MRTVKLDRPAWFTHLLIAAVLFKTLFQLKIWVLLCQSDLLLSQILNGTKFVHLKPISWFLMALTLLSLNLD